MIKKAISALKEYYERIVFTLKLLKDKPIKEEAKGESLRIAKTIIPEGYKDGGAEFVNWANKLGVSCQVPRSKS
jgi:hypothetical protein